MTRSMCLRISKDGKTNNVCKDVKPITFAQRRETNNVCAKTG